MTEYTAIFFGLFPTPDSFQSYYDQDESGDSDDFKSIIGKDFGFKWYDHDWIEQSYVTSALDPNGLVQNDIEKNYHTYPYYLSLGDYYRAAAVVKELGITQINCRLDLGNFDKTLITKPIGINNGSYKAVYCGCYETMKIASNKKKPDA